MTDRTTDDNVVDFIWHRRRHEIEVLGLDAPWTIEFEYDVSPVEPDGEYGLRLVDGEEQELPDPWELCHAGPADRIVYGCSHGEVYFLHADVVDQLVALLAEWGSLSGWYDDDPPWLARYQIDWLPESIVDELATTDITPDGECIRFAADTADAVVAALEAGGAWCRRDDEVVERLVREFA